MRGLEQLYDELVNLCYEAALDEQAWSKLLGRLAQATGRQQGALLLWDQKHDGGQVSTFYQLEPRAADDYNNYYCNMDPTRFVMKHRETGSWYHDFQERGADDIRRDPYYQEYKLPYGMKNVSAMKIHKYQCAEAFVSLVINKDARLPTQQQALLLDRVTPHLLRATNIHFKFNALELELGKRNLLLDRHPTPLWLLDEDGRVVYSNAAAERAMRTSAFGLYERAGRLHAHRDDARLVHHRHKASGKTEARHASRLRLSGVDEEILIVPVGADAPFNHQFQKPLVLIAYLDNTLQSHLLAELFQLSPAERRLAELLAQGLAPEHCASVLNISINTVRTQLRALFRKTNTERQAELVSLLVRTQL